METEITYRLEVEDLFKTFKYWHKINKSIHLVKLFAYTLFIVTIIQTLLKAQGELWSKLFVGILTLGISIISLNLFVYFFSFLVFRVNLPKDEANGILCEHTIRITPTQLIEKTLVNETYCNWISVKHLHELPNHLLIIFGVNQVHIIPKRAFASTSSYQTFYEMTQQFIEQSRQTH